VAEVSPGDIFEVETELNIGAHLITSLDEKLSLSDVTIPFVIDGMRAPRRPPHPNRGACFRLKNANVNSSLAIEPPLAEICFM
jgi:hypothetical protein